MKLPIYKIEDKNMGDTYFGLLKSKYEFYQAYMEYNSALSSTERKLASMALCYRGFEYLKALHIHNQSTIRTPLHRYDYFTVDIEDLYDKLRLKSNPVNIKTVISYEDSGSGTFELYMFLFLSHFENYVIDKCKKSS